MESVAWISERKNVLSGLFFFAAFYVYLGFSETGRTTTFLAVVGLYVLALLSKMNTVVLPAVCLAYEVAFRFRLRRQDVMASLPLFAIGGLVVAYNLAGNPIHATGYHGGSVIVTGLTSAVVVFRYLGHLVWPVGLRSGYHIPLRGSPVDPPVLLALLGLAAIAAVTVWLYRRRRPETFWVLWFWITLGPMLNIVPFRSLIQDRYMYLALLGPVVLGTALALRAQSRRLRYGLAVAATVGVVALSVMSHRQVEMWDTPLSLWKGHVLRENHLYGDLFYISRDHQRKVAYLEQVLVGEPDHPVANNNLGSLYVAERRPREALLHFERAARVAPDDATILLNLGRTHAASGNRIDAKPLVERSVTLEPHSYVGRLSLARIYLAERNAARAREQLEACARIKPHLVQKGRIRKEWAELKRLEGKRSNPLP